MPESDKSEHGPEPQTETGPETPEPEVSTVTPAEVEPDNGGGSKKAAPQMVLKKIIKDEVTFIKGKSGCGKFATFTKGGVTQTVEIGTQPFTDWMLRRFEQVDGRIAARNVLDDVSAWCSAQADNISKAKAKRVFTRNGEYGGKLYLNLGEGRIIEIDGEGWRSVSTSPVLFRETPEDVCLPDPVHSTNPHSINLLRKQMNLGAEMDWRLIVTWMVHTFFPTFRGYAVLNFGGYADVGKSWMQSKILSCVDPADEADDDSETDTAYDDVRDFLVACTQNWVIRFGNVSRITAEQSDKLAIIAQPGYKVVERRLYSNGGVYKRKIHGPAIMGGITDFIRRPDLVSRTFFIEVPEIDEDVEFIEEVMSDTFLKEQPEILGGLLDAVSHVLNVWKEAQKKCTKKTHRLTDFMTVGVALESFFGWGAGSFKEIIVERSDDAQQETLESLIYYPLIERLLLKGNFKGSASDFVTALRGEQRNDEALIYKDVMPHTLASQLRRYKRPLKLAGIEFSFGRTNNKRWITLTNVPYTKPTETEAEAEPQTQESDWQEYRVKFDAGVVDELTATIIDAGLPKPEEM